MPLQCNAIGTVFLAFGDDELGRNVLAAPLEPRTITAS